MAAIVAVYKTPKDVAAFNAYFFAKHVPLAKKLPGLRRCRVSDGAVGLPAEPGAVQVVAILEFDNLEAIQKALVSPEAQATAMDFGNFTDGGVDLMVFNTKDV